MMGRECLLLALYLRLLSLQPGYILTGPTEFYLNYEWIVEVGAEMMGVLWSIAAVQA